MRVLTLTLSVATLVVSGSHEARAQNLPPIDNYVIADHVPRFALAIGVETYDHFDPVPNAENDRDAAIEAFEAADFDTVMTEPDPTLPKLQTVLRRLTQLAAQSGRPAVVAIFFAGHGFQEGTNNYIVPKDARPATLVEDSLKISNVLERLARSSGVTFVFLDACRTLSPLVKPERPGGVQIPLKPGFAQAGNFAGTIQIFAAKWGQAALSKAHQDDRNSPYSAALRQFLNSPSDSIGTIYSNVFTWVRSRTNPEQEPEISAVSSTATIRFMPLSNPSDLLAEERHWRAVLATSRTACVKEFLNGYPDSRYAVAAVKWLAETAAASVNSLGGEVCPKR